MDIKDFFVGKEVAILKDTNAMYNSKRFDKEFSPIIKGKVVKVGRSIVTVQQLDGSNIETQYSSKHIGELLGVLVFGEKTEFGSCKYLFGSVKDAEDYVEKKIIVQSLSQYNYYSSTSLDTLREIENLLKKDFPNYKRLPVKQAF